MMRQAFGGLFWTKQYYFFDVNMWLREHGVDPFDSQSDTHVRNRQWFHMFNDDVISMPDKWEYPWYAAWDLAFHAIGMARIDPDFAKHQLTLMLKARYQHSNGQLPAYEWNFSDVNPPVHAWAMLFQYRTEQAMRGEGDVEFLKRAFGKLVINFTWWVNRKDRLGQERVRGRISRSRQHRRVRSQRRVADRRSSRAGRRHRVDGDVLPEHVRDRDRTGGARSQLRRSRLQVRRALPVDWRRPEQGWRRRDVGRRGWLLLRRAAPAGRQASRASRFVRWSACCRSAPRR